MPRSLHPLSAILAVLATGMALAAQGVPYLKLTAPVRILPTPQPWEGNEQPHTLSVVELNRGGYRYWGYYGLNEGRGTGLCRSNDLVHWTKYKGNPLWRNARWTSVLAGADPAHPKRLFFAITRDYDTPRSRIVLASSDDGIHLKEVKQLVAPQDAPRNRNQNPNLTRDPVSGKVAFLFYRGNDDDHFDIVLRQADSVLDLDTAPEKVLLHDTETLAAPTLLYVKNALGEGKGAYYLVTEIYPGRRATPPAGEWQVKVFWSAALEGPYEPVTGNPVQAGERACLFQHVFNGRYYGYQSHLEHPSEKWIMELIQAPLP